MSDPSPVSHQQGDQAIRNTSFIRGHQKQRRISSASPAVHNVLFVQYDSPVSKIDPCLLQGYIRHGAIIMPVSTTGHGRHGAILWGTRGYIMGEIADLEFEIHKNEKKCIFLPIEQAGTNIC